MSKGVAHCAANRVGERVQPPGVVASQEARSRKKEGRLEMRAEALRGHSRRLAENVMKSPARTEYGENRHTDQPKIIEDRKNKTTHGRKSQPRTECAQARRISEEKRRQVITKKSQQGKVSPKQRVQRECRELDHERHRRGKRGPEIRKGDRGSRTTNQRDGEKKPGCSELEKRSNR